MIHTNDQQMAAALVSAHSLKTRSSTPERFDVRMLRLEETPHLYMRDRQRFIPWTGDEPSVWRRRDSQSFAPLRRKVPADLGFSGRALVIDPDVFAVSDVYELLARDMKGKAIMCRPRRERRDGRLLYNSSVMLLDCSKLRHWNWDRDIDEIFACKLEMGPWLSLLDESPDQIELFEEEWNHLDTLTDDTKLLHNTEILTQPWKTGLRADFHSHAPRGPAFYEWLRRRVTTFPVGNHHELRYRPHPDTSQEHMFFTLLKECVEQESITTRFLRTAIRKGYVRRDAFSILEKIHLET